MSPLLVGGVILFVVFVITSLYNRYSNKNKTIDEIKKEVENKKKNKKFTNKPKPGCNLYKFSDNKKLNNLTNNLILEIINISKTLNYNDLNTKLKIIDSIHSNNREFNQLIQSKSNDKLTASYNSLESLISKKLIIPVIDGLLINKSSTDFNDKKFIPFNNSFEIIDMYYDILINLVDTEDKSIINKNIPYDIDNFRKSKIIKLFIAEYLLIIFFNIILSPESPSTREFEQDLDKQILLFKKYINIDELCKMFNGIDIYEILKLILKNIIDDNDRNPSPLKFKNKIVELENVFKVYNNYDIDKGSKGFTIYYIINSLKMNNGNLEFDDEDAYVLSNRVRPTALEKSPSAISSSAKPPDDNPPGDKSPGAKSPGIKRKPRKKRKKKGPVKTDEEIASEEKRIADAMALLEELEKEK